MKQPFQTTAKMLLAVLVILCMSGYSTAQTISIDSTFTSDAIIYPFGPNDTLYSLKINGNIALNSDTSLVRVIVGNSDSLEYMIYESYPLIASYNSFSIVGKSDETTFLEAYSPKYLKIYLVNATVTIDSLNDSEEYAESLDSLQIDAKIGCEELKAEIMQDRIEDFGMHWFSMADPTLMMYKQKSDIFGEKYNMLGWDYYSWGIYERVDKIQDRTQDNSGMAKEFDWREKHDAHLENTPYHDGNPDVYLYTCDPQSYNIYESGNGWMTSVKDQDVCGESLCNSACYTYAVTGAIESVSNLFYNHHYNFDLSEQQCLDCSNYDCQGGYPGPISLIAKNDGLVNEYCYPWIDAQGICRDPIYCDNSQDPEYQIKISNWQNADLSSTNKLKEDIINHGPLASTVYNSNGNSLHCMVLCGYQVIQVGDVFYSNSEDSLVIESGDNIVGYLMWIFKNSYSPHNDANGYKYVLHHPDLFYFSSGNPYTYYYETPITDIIGDNEYTNHCYDMDNDGYYNWGLCDYADKTYCGCESSNPGEEDSNDNDGRIGSFDDNYYGIPVKPQISVFDEDDNEISNEGFYIFPSLQGSQAFTFTVQNNGNAQLNFDPDNNIPPSADVILTGNEGSAFSYNDPEKLDLNIEMGGGSDSFEITYDGSLNTQSECCCIVTIPLNEPDMEDFTFAIIYANCDQTPSNQTIGSTPVTWDGWRVIADNYKIGNGEELTITGNVGFTDQANLVVDKGGTLIIDGGHLVNACPGFWKGIDVWGDAALPQSPYSNQGVLQINNGGCIENAEIGAHQAKVRADGTDYPSYSGGIIRCNDAIFKNNEVDVKFTSYNNFHAGTGSPLPNQSRFSNTLFLNDNICDKPWYVILPNVDGIQFNGCVFKNDVDKVVHSCDNPLNDYEKGTGIYSSSAGFYVRDHCIESTYGTGCDETYYSRFENLEYGIHASNAGYNEYIVVDTAIFYNTQKGIYMVAMDNSEITRSLFTWDEDFDPEGIYRYGVDLQSCMSFMIEENHFQNTSSETDMLGLQILNGGPYAHEVYNNSFKGFNTGITAAGENRNGSGEGLCLKCNDFIECETDIFVTHSGGTNQNYLGIALTQGNYNHNSEDPAGNTFTMEDYGSLESNYNNESLPSITYIHHRDNSLLINIKPDEVVKLLNEEDLPNIYNKEQSCPSNLGGGINTESERSIVNSEAAIISAYQDTLNLLVDGGNTEELNLEVQTSFPNEALIVRQELINESPYLSDTIMKSAIYQETVLPNAMIRDVLVANPQSAKSLSVLDALEERFFPMPEYMIDEIMLGQYSNSAKEQLEGKLGNHVATRTKSFQKLTKYYRTDTISIWAIDSLLLLLTSEFNPYPRYVAASIFLDLGDTISLQNTLENVITDIEMSEQDLFIHGLYSDLFDILQEIQNDTTSIIDSLRTQELMNIAQYVHLKPGIIARNVLIEGGIIDYDEPIYLSNSYKNTEVEIRPPINKNDIQNRVKLFPNPANQYFIVEYDLENNFNDAVMAIVDLNGKLIESSYISDKKNQVFVNTLTYKPGMYVLLIYANGEIVETQKVQIIK